ncbi:MAG: HAMP domain-containing sensor histidine kinase [Ginsengibacter sp.]
MKLLAKYNKVNIPITIATLLISGIAYYFILHYVLLHQLDKDLYIEKEEIFHFIDKNKALPESSNYKDQQISFHLTTSDSFKDKISTETIFDKKEGEEESFRRLDFFVQLYGNNYMAIVKKSQQETEDIVSLILKITFSVIVFLLIVLFMGNHFLLGKLWKPFYNTLEQLKQFTLSSKNEMNLQETGIDEFAELNATAILMTEKVRSDYEALKNFTENASHEIQTPLAIIKTKLELLTQSEKLDETQVNAIKSLNEATSRLSKLNHSLLLLTKIDNKQFVETEPVNISLIILRYLENFEELAVTKNIRVVKNIVPNKLIKMNESLAGILISNIISNAIKHNHRNGSIEINLDEKRLIVCNTGPVPVKEPARLFERFQKDAVTGDSLGLGLSIVKKIGDISDFSVSYQYEQDMHRIEINFG